MSLSKIKLYMIKAAFAFLDKTKIVKTMLLCIKKKNGEKSTCWF